MRSLRSGVVLPVVMAAGVSVILGACAIGSLAPESEGNSSMSRVQLYDDIDSLVSDSDVVVVGRVAEQEVVADIDPITDFTLSRVLVDEVVSGDAVEVGDAVVVRQLGSAEQAAPVEILAAGKTYLLYLTESGLDGSLASQFYVTGANAGIYEQEAANDLARGSSDPLFVQSDPQEDEQLPSEIRRSGAAG